MSFGSAVEVALCVQERQHRKVVGFTGILKADFCVLTQGIRRLELRFDGKLLKWLKLEEFGAKKSFSVGCSSKVEVICSGFVRTS